MSRTPTKVRARRERVSEYFSALREPPCRDSDKSCSLKYSPSGRHVNISTVNLLYENSDFAVFHKERDFQPNHLASFHHENEGITSKQHDKDFSKFLLSLWKDKRMCDIVLKVDGKELPAHKIALAAYSDKFTSRYCEEAPTTVSEIILSNGSVEAAEVLLDYIYTSELKTNLDNLEEVIVCARQLGINSAVCICESQISNFNIENVLSLFTIAERLGMTDLTSKMHQFVCENFLILSRSPAFLRACAEHIRWVISKDELSANSELDVFFACLAWIDYNRQDRLRFAVDLMQCIRFVYISPEDLVSHVETAEHVFNISECRNLLYEAFRYHALKLSGSPLFSSLFSNVLPRRFCSGQNKSDKSKPSNNKKGFTEIPSQQNPNSTSTVKEKSNQVTPINSTLPCNVNTKDTNVDPPANTCPQDPPPLPIPPRPATIVTLGGINPFTEGIDITCRIVEEYNPSTNGWKALTNLPMPLHHLGAAMLDGFLFVVGGSIISKDEPSNLSNSTDICFRFDPLNLCWSRIACLKTPRMYHATATLEGVLYAVCGQFQLGRALNTVEYYNPDTDTWEMTSPASEEKIGAAAAGHHSKLFVVGGFMDTPKQKVVLDSVEFYDPTNNSWSRLNPLPTPCCHSNLVEANHHLYLIGGSTVDPSGYTVISLSDVLRYNDVNDVWEPITNLRIERHDAGATVIGRRIYIVGGICSSINDTLADIECLDLDTGHWLEKLDPMTHPAMGVTCCTIPEQGQ